MEGVLSEDDVLKELGVGAFDIWLIKRAICYARQGMIPAANAIQIPPESEWPKDATDIQLLYTNPSTVFMRIPIAIIPRSKPAWKPKVGDKIAYWFDGMTAVYFGEYGNLDEVFRNEPHYAKVEQLSDIGHDIAWFKANRSWI